MCLENNDPFMLQKPFKYFFLILAIALVGCAKRGTITGGLKDTLSPVLRTAIPKNYNTNFTGKTIRLNFDEYVKLKNINKQLIVSPPMKTAPEVLPTNASKYITIKIKDTLQSNTTYSFNFGQSIEDNNEANPYKQFKYVFSTGSYIDSLTLSGKIKDAYSKKTDNFVTVMLYDVDEKLTDSIIYKQNPRYVTNTLDSATVFKLENLKPGKYLLVALKDLNSNYKFNPRAEKIGFHQQYVTVPNDTLYEIELFKEALPFKALKPTQASGNRAYVGYEGNPKDAKITLTKGMQPLDVIVTQLPKKDSLQVWFKPIKLDADTKTDSLHLNISKADYTQNFTFKIKNQKADTLSFTPNYKSELPLKEKFAIAASVPLVKFDLSKIELINKDSTAVPFTTDYDVMKQELNFDFKKEPLEKYKIKLMPGAMVDFMDRENDTLVYSMATKNTSDYGNLIVNLENVKQFPVIIELTNKDGAVEYSEYSEGNTKIDFNLIKPALYTLRVIYDENKNKVWDTGSFLQKRQTEQVIYFPKDVDVRANWDVEQPFSLTP